MADLHNIISNCFQNRGHTNQYWTYRCLTYDGKISHLVIPIADTFEVPVFVLNSMQNVSSCDSIVATLQDVNVHTGYKSLDAGMREILTMDFNNCRLVSIPVKAGEPLYYGTYGAIFNKDFVPIMMLSWQISKQYCNDNVSDGNFLFRFVRPILRVDPIVFLNKSNSVERYIINKIIPAALSYGGDTDRPGRGIGNNFINDDLYSNFHLKVEIDKFPFTLVNPDVPSVSTTNEKLMQVALDNIEDIIL